ncbi:HIT family protein [Raineyella fluvialis]|uniref:HIT domain-containing protein n=1 Tax=Raineyella fluvialis TaxID=2662261 RepID=A0A5Q2FHU7_9ACTN|nr:HIT domain-containing protein [Raineyella fluvialis]QGF24733.1 HIT domain-containing protein [Raineyella fluvialis]
MGVQPEHTGGPDEGLRDGQPAGGEASTEPISVDASTLAGDPDVFDRLWVAHRMAYVGGDKHPRTAAGDACPFCTAPLGSDEDGLIVHRGALAYVLLNLYPYNAGHLMVCPYRHVPDYTELTTDEVIEVAELTRTAMTVLRTVSSAQGFNLGMNQGEVAGAGIAAHLHQHVVPRWRGDANFFPIVARTKAIPQLLGQTRELLAAAWPVAPSGQDA